MCTQMTSAEALIITWLRGPDLWRPASFFPLPALSPPNGLMNKVAVEAGMVMHGPSNMGLC